MKLKITGEKSLILKKKCEVVSHYDTLALLYIDTKGTIEDVQTVSGYDNGKHTPGIAIDFDGGECVMIDFLDYTVSSETIYEDGWVTIGLHHGSDYVYVTLSKEI